MITLIRRIRAVAWNAISQVVGEIAVRCYDLADRLHGIHGHLNDRADDAGYWDFYAIDQDGRIVRRVASDGSPVTTRQDGTP